MVASWLIYLAVVVVSTAASYGITAITQKDIKSSNEKNKLDSLDVQTSDYGNMIPILYGTMRFAGEVIWCDEIKEHIRATITTQGGKGGGKAKTTTKEYTYTVSLAIAVCEGEIEKINKCWADSNELNVGNNTDYYTIYRGTEDQLPDPFIQGIEGINNTPGYRGIAYVVIKNFILTDYGNRIPNFTFEVERKRITNDTAPQDNITSICINNISEFECDTEPVYNCFTHYDENNTLKPLGSKKSINITDISNKSDAIISLGNLKETFKNINYININVNWFSDSIILDNNFSITPKVEYLSTETNIELDYFETYPCIWKVKDYTRRNASILNNPLHYGTSNDDSLIRYLDYCRNTLHYNIMFNPTLLIDNNLNQSIGDIKANTIEEVDLFFNSYNNFIMYYANLVNNYINSFIIGSSLVGITSYYYLDSNNNRIYCGVNKLKQLANQVKDYFKSINKNYIKVIYSADYKEYHSSNDFFNLDDLWSDDNIDVIGINYYMPLTDKLEQDNITYDTIYNGITGGEGWDYYYNESDIKKENKIYYDLETPQEPFKYAWKNINYWYNNYHTNPNTIEHTSYIPNNKEIWFTEIGFNSIDCVSNDPYSLRHDNTFNSKLPINSNGRIDNSIQKLCLTAIIDYFKINTNFIKQLFIYNYDIRPYPSYPKYKSKWGDEAYYGISYNIQGKIGDKVSSQDIITDILLKSGIDKNKIYFDNFIDCDDIKGYIISSRTTYKDIIKNLSSLFFFDAIESDGVLKFTMRKNLNVVRNITEDDLIPTTNENNETEYLIINRNQSTELSKKVEVIYKSYLRDYNECKAEAVRETYSEPNNETVLNVPYIAMDLQQAKKIAEINLYSIWTQRNNYSFKLLKKHLDLEPLDLIQYNNHIIKISSMESNRDGIIVKGIGENTDIYKTYNDILNEYQNNLNDYEPKISNNNISTIYQLLDLPPLQGEDDTKSGIIKIAITADDISNWKGSNIYISNNNEDYNLVLSTESGNTIGYCVNKLETTNNHNIIDLQNTITISLINNNLETINREQLYEGYNLALVGNEIIQFQKVEEIDYNIYKLSILARGLYGTDYYIDKHNSTNEMFILLKDLKQSNIPLGYINVNKYYRAQTINNETNFEDIEPILFTYKGNKFKPYSLCHIKTNRDINNSLNISWQRRTRIGGEWRDNVDALLVEEKEQYKINIIEQNRNKIIRTIVVNNQQIITYTAEQQIEDFGTIQNNIKFNICQLSSVIGDGYEKAVFG